MYVAVLGCTYIWSELFLYLCCNDALTGLEKCVARGEVPAKPCAMVIIAVKVNPTSGNLIKFFALQEEDTMHKVLSFLEISFPKELLLLLPMLPLTLV